MKFQFTHGDVPQQIRAALVEQKFNQELVQLVIGDWLGVSNPLDKPAEHQVVRPEECLSLGQHEGVMLTLSGVTRNGREHKQIHRAIRQMEQLAIAQLQRALQSPGLHWRLQFRCVIELDGEVEVQPSSGYYSRWIERDPVWLETKEETAEEEREPSGAATAGNS